MNEMRSQLAVEEYRALRATIRQRGTARVVIAAFIFVAWAGGAAAVQALFSTPVTTLVPLLVLAAGFEAVYSLHIGVERIGRYLQVQYERPVEGPPAWEHTAMRFGQEAGSAGRSDPLFGGYFVVAILLNLIPAALMSLNDSSLSGAVPAELMVYGTLHLLVVFRIVLARRFATSQRERDLKLLSTTPPSV